MYNTALFALNQAVAAACTFIELMGAIIFLCYIVRNWPPEVSKLRYQLSFALFLVFLTAAMRDAITTAGWWLGPEKILRFLQEWRLIVQMPRVGIILGLLLAIRAVTYESHKNKIIKWLLVGTVLVFLGGLYFPTLS